MNKTKNKKKIIIISIIAVIAIIAIAFFTLTKDKTEYNSVTVKNKDLVTYLNFSGYVQTENSNEIISPQTLKVKKVNVSEGDTIKKGDIIAVLDTEDLEKQLKTQESNVEINNINLSYSYSQSKKNYTEAKMRYDNGLNPDINNAEKAVESSRNSMETYQKEYDDSQKKLDEHNNEKIREAKSRLVPDEINYNASKNEYHKLLNKYCQPEDVEKILESENKLIPIQIRIDEAKSDMRTNQGVDTKAVEEAAQRLNDAQDDYDEILDDIYDSIHYSIVKAARKEMEEYKKIYDETKDTLNDTIQDIDTNLSNIKMMLDNAKINYDKAQIMLEIAKLGALQQLDSLERAMERDKKIVENNPSLLELANLRERIEDCTIKSEYDGTIINVYAQEGTMVSMGQPIADVIDASDLEVKIKIDEYDAPTVKTGSEVSVYINSLDTEIKGTIKSISEAATVQNGIAFFTADVTISETSNIKSGMSAEVKLLKEKAENTPCLPMSALRFDDDNKPFVYVKKSGKIIEQYITIGINDGNKVEIKEGLVEGDTIYVPKSLGISMFEMMGM